MISKNNFQGTINDKNIWWFVKQLDWDLETTDDRLNHLNKVLGAYEIDGCIFYDSFFEDLFDQDREHSKINLILSASNPRYDESNISTVLEILETYILCSKDELQRRKKDNIVYKLYNKKDFEKRLKQESELFYKLSINGDRSNNYDNCDHRKDFSNESTLDVLQLPKNYKKVKDIKINHSDFNKYPILKEYQKSYDHLKDQYAKLLKINLNGIKDEDERKFIASCRKMAKDNLKSIKIDMLDIKKKIERPIIWKAPLKDNGCPSWDEFDMFDRDQVKELLRVHRGNDLQDDLTCIVQDLNNLIKKTKFTDKQYKILQMYRDGASLQDISFFTMVDVRNLNKSINSIVNKIIKQYEKEYINWYYLNICKGEYKRCSRCGEIKLVQEFSKSGEGYRSNCKDCK